ncbi:MAG: hypothetical protein IPH31_00240 [Lewinellaceae bacterium]|nr:hypothetical protein [Lewinellaceae bacterium]
MVTETESPDDFAGRYHFTSTAREFKTLALQLLNSEQQTIGVLVLTLRDGHLRVPQHAGTPMNTPPPLPALSLHTEFDLAPRC